MLRFIKIAFLAIAIVLLLLPTSSFAQDDGTGPPQPLLTHRSQTGGYTFDFPATWTLLREGDGTTTLVSDPYIMHKLDNNFETLFGDETLVTISFVPTAHAESGYGIVGTNAAERLESLARRLASDIDRTALITLDNGIVRLRLRKGVDDTSEFVGMLAVWDVAPDVMGVAMLMTAQGNFQAAYDLTEPVMLSAQFTAPIQDVIDSALAAQEAAEEASQ